MTLADVVAGIIFAALNVYALLGGADFGGGVWDLLATGPRKQRQRELIADAIGPVWEANHVWLILAIVLLFTCFPPAFARLGTRLHIPLALGLFALVAFAFLAAVYLTLEAGEERELAEDFRRRALAAGAALFGAAVLVLVLSLRYAPLVRDGLIFAAWAVPLHLVTAAAAVTALAALWFRRWRLARVAAAAQVSLILWGWALGQYPYLLPPDLTIAAAAAPAVTLRLVLGALALGAAVLFPSLFYLFRIFKGSRPSAVRP